MLYKRHEYFRYEFKEPLEANFKMLLAEGTFESKPGMCRLLDISPGGGKMYTNYEFPDVRGAVQIRLTCTLFKEPLMIDGQIVWKKKDKAGYQYGVDFNENPLMEQLIVDELKLRRQSENQK